MGTAATSSYSDYEQLVGGIETLFGAGGAANVKEYADSVGKAVYEIQDEYNMLMEAQELAMSNAGNAYKNAGMSANEYMQTVTSFAASLKQSTENEVEAAKAADQAIIDMSDNANKMGTSMESIQNAYQGFAKQNYTMLDNLKLGYGGTKGEMERLLDDATKLSGIEYDIDNLADVYAAIHVVQTELGITGTTAKEASSTISGSLGAMKSAWTNLVTGLADGEQDLDSLIANFVETVGPVVQNILPVVETVLAGVGDLAEALLPTIVERIPELISDILPQLLESGINMITTLVEGMQQSLPEIMDGALLIVELLVTSFTALLPQILEIGLQIIVQLALGLAKALPILIPTVVEVILTFVQILIDNIPLLIEAALELMTGLITGLLAALPVLIEALPEIIIALVTTLIENIPLIMECALQLVMGLMTGLLNALPTLIEMLPQIVIAIVTALIENLPMICDCAFQLVMGLVNGIIDALPALIEMLPQVVISIVTALLENLPLIVECALQLVMGLATGLIDALPVLIEMIPDIIMAIVNTLIELAPQLMEAALTIITTLGDALVTYLPQLLNKIPGIVTTLKDKFIQLVSNFADIGKNIVDGIWTGISNGWDALKEKVKELADGLFGAAKEALGIASPSKKFRYLAEMCVAGFDEGMDGLMDPNGMIRDINTVMKSSSVGAREIVGMRSEQFEVVTYVYLEGEAGGIFRVVRQENDIFKKATGESALA